MNAVIFLLNIIFRCSVIAYVSLCFVVPLAQAADAVTPRSKALKIKVLLHEADACVSQRWQFDAIQGFYLFDPVHNHKIKSGRSELIITACNDVLVINGRRSKKKQIILRPINGHISFQSKKYDGDFLIINHNKKIYIINRLRLEDYIVSVLRTESWPGWPLEINKVLAIACRSYAFAMMKHSKKNKLFYDIKNDNRHQTYSGIHQNTTLKKAVEETKGMFLMHNNEPILAMFDSCCGSVKPVDIDDFDFSKVPYLARTYACDFCKKAPKIFHWKAEYELKELQLKCAAHLPKGTMLRDIRVSKKDKAGIVNELLLKSGRASYSLTGKKMYSLCKEKIKSFCYKVQKKGSKIVFVGRGYGHHIGLCQWGARYMVGDGWDFASVLHFYYPGTLLAKLV